MLEEILPNMYRIEIPLPNSPLKALNSYLVKGGERFLIIDTGLNHEQCKREMLSSLKRLNVDLKKTDFLITHWHMDHLGLVGDIATNTSRVYFNELEATVSNSLSPEQHWGQQNAILIAHGFPEDELEKAMKNHPGSLYGLKRHVDFATLEEDDTIEMGDYSFRCIETPGHSPGHTCLYEANKKLLISGDHILFDITPNIIFWSKTDNSLKQYLASLEKVYAIDVALVLPGHRGVCDNHRKRIVELQEHHQVRLKEILSALGDGEKTAFQIAPWVSWDIDCSSWELFPPSQKWFAVGETIAHLRYLEEERMIRRKTEEQKVIFSLA